MRRANPPRCVRSPSAALRCPGDALLTLPDFSKHAYAYVMMPDPALPFDVRPTTGLLKALADDNRLRMLALLAGGELCVCHIASSLELSQPNASQHLTVLRNAGAVESERRGSWIYYRINHEQDSVRERILRAVLDGFTDLAAAEEDRRRLMAAKSAVTCG